MTMTNQDPALPPTGAVPARCPVTGAVASADVPGPRRPEGPKGLPGVGITMDMGRAPLDFSLRLQRDHGGVVRVRLWPRPFIQITEPEAIERVLVGNPGNYRRGRLYEPFHQFMGKGLLTLDDDEWRAHRRVVQPAFTPQKVRESVEETVAAVTDLFDSWDVEADRQRSFDLVRPAMSLSARIMGKALIGRSLASRERTFTRAVAAGLESIFKNVSSVEEYVLPRWLPTAYQRRKRWARRFFDQVIASVKAERQATGEFGDDAAGLIMKSDLPESALPDNLRTMFLAGSETTGLSLAWALYELARHPSVRREVEREVDEVLAGRTPTFDDLAALPVVQSVVDETLRLYPSVWQFPRDAVEPDELAGHEIPATSTVMVSVYATHRNPAYWDAPNSFDPSRFRDPSAKDRPKFAYLPFGGGRRQCIGKPLAVPVLATAVAMVCQRYRLWLPYGTENVSPEGFITIFPPKFPDGGLTLGLTRRDGR
ncbi:cytochrome P450 [Micromonospora wenchangensis]|uniref:Cytochrome P450 n=1 Tax=Micromonospora wenchangensis TaxID=1185415 RepID=A0A246RNB0_9ACTN|nr:cytochrome P450 [Micromonospora wenchangensis]OWV08700.1 hypothetical protein B5D80_11415 [Micromonospora wenchangensis]